MTSEAVCEVRAIDVIAAIDRTKELEAENARLLAENSKLRAVFTWVTADVAREWAEGTWVLMRHKDSLNISLSQWHRPDWAATHFRDVLFVNIDRLKPEEALKGGAVHSSRDRAAEEADGVT